MPITELLIHVSGPSSRRADDYFRTLARTYNEFETVHEIDFTRGDKGDAITMITKPITAEVGVEDRGGFAQIQEGLDVQLRSEVEVEGVGEEKEEEEAVVDYIDDTPRAIAALESQIFTSSLAAVWDEEESISASHENEGEQEMVEDRQRQSEETGRELYQAKVEQMGGELESEEVWEFARSRVLDSGALQGSRSRTGGRKDKSMNGPSTYMRHSPRSESEESVGGEIPRPKRRKLSIAQNSGALRAPIWDMAQNTKFTSPARQTHIAASITPQQVPLPSHKTSAAVLPSSPKKLPPALTPSTALTTTILPQPPPPSPDEPPTTHLTPALINLVNTDNLASRYMLLSQTRSLRPQERGYWLVPSPATALWTEELCRECWDVLSGFIGTGQAGWGVSCIRVLDSTADTTSFPDKHFGNLRIYCWGELVQHIYLLLFVATKSKIKRAGAMWIDGDGLTVIQMA